MQLPAPALLHKDEDLFATIFELAIRVVNLGIRHFGHDLIVAIELFITERDRVGFQAFMTFAEVLGNCAASDDSIAAWR